MLKPPDNAVRQRAQIYTIAPGHQIRHQNGLSRYSDIAVNCLNNGRQAFAEGRYRTNWFAKCRRHAVADINRK